MSYHFHSDERIATGVRRIAMSQINKAISEIDDAELNRDETIHQVRKRCKMLRGLIRLVRPSMEKTYQIENNAFRDAARTLSDIRDAKSAISAYDHVMERFADQVDRKSFASVRRQLTRELKAIDNNHIDRRLDFMREQMVAAKTRLDDWSFDDKKFKAAAAGLSKTRERAVEAMGDAKENATTENLHELRKRVKYHGYHLRLLRELWPATTRPLIELSDRLGEDLGDDHDLAVFAKKVLATPEKFGDADDVRVLEGLIEQHHKQLQHTSLKRGSFLFAEDTDAFARRMHSYWRIWSSRPAD
jgi:CHAD domain-containing protein